MFDKKRHALYMAIYFKYDNNLIPTIPKLLVSYLLEYPSRINLYLNNHIHIGMILERLCLMYETKGDIDILEEIKQYVEVDLCKTT